MKAFILSISLLCVPAAFAVDGPSAQQQMQAPAPAVARAPGIEMPEKAKRLICEEQLAELAMSIVAQQRAAKKNDPTMRDGIPLTVLSNIDEIARRPMEIDEATYTTHRGYMAPLFNGLIQRLFAQELTNEGFRSVKDVEWGMKGLKDRTPEQKQEFLAKVMGRLLVRVDTTLGGSSPEALEKMKRTAKEMGVSLEELEKFLNHWKEYSQTGFRDVARVLRHVMEQPTDKFTKAVGAQNNWRNWFYRIFIGDKMLRDPFYEMQKQTLVQLVGEDPNRNETVLQIERIKLMPVETIAFFLNLKLDSLRPEVLKAALERLHETNGLFDLKQAVEGRLQNLEDFRHAYAEVQTFESQLNSYGEVTADLNTDFQGINRRLGKLGESEQAGKMKALSLDKDGIDRALLEVVQRAIQHRGFLADGEGEIPQGHSLLAGDDAVEVGLPKLAEQRQELSSLIRQWEAAREKTNKVRSRIEGRENQVFNPVRLDAAFKMLNRSSISDNDRMNQLDIALSELSRSNLTKKELTNEILELTKKVANEWPRNVEMRLESYEHIRDLVVTLDLTEKGFEAIQKRVFNKVSKGSYDSQRKKADELLARPWRPVEGESDEEKLAALEGEEQKIRTRVMKLHRETVQGIDALNEWAGRHNQEMPVTPE